MEQRLIDRLKEAGATLVGFAPLQELAPEQRRDFLVGVSIAIALRPGVVAGIPSGPHYDYHVEYVEVNQQLDRLGLEVEAFLREQGYRAYAVTGERVPYQRDTCRTALPHKTVARLAGFGWIGRNALLVTSSYGCAVRLTTVLTDAPLTVNHTIPENRCGSCGNCKSACPGNAIQGIRWESGVDRDQLVSTDICQEVFAIRSAAANGQKHGTCGLCLAACPWTARYLRREGVAVSSSV